MAGKAPRKRAAPHDGVYARIGPSRLHGVGVIALRDIPKGTQIFRGESERVVWVSRATVRRLPRAVRALYEDFGMVDGRRLGVPRSLNRLSVGWYVNHGDVPNVEAGDDGRFRALRRIRAGEELTADYRTFADEPLPFRPRKNRVTLPQPARRVSDSRSREVAQDAGSKDRVQRGPRRGRETNLPDSLLPRAGTGAGTARTPTSELLPDRGRRRVRPAR